MKKFFSALLVVLFASTMMAQTGLTCENPIHVDKNYQGTITEAGEYWFTANTYDLPLNVHFSPLSNNSEWGPEVYVDFTCTEGVYDNPKLDSVINGMTDFGLTLPVEFLCDKVVRDGKVEWDLSINENYRENLTRCGIIDNTQAFVRVYFSEPGKISLQPDTSYQSCMENERVKLGDTLDILPNDADRVFVLPYSEWKKDSIQFTWLGDGSVDIWISDMECEFTPVGTSAYVKAHYTSTATTPHKLQPKDIESAVQNWLGGGVYFAKVMAKGAGKLIVENIPLGPIQGNAILLKHGEPMNLQANDNRVFCFPKSWKGTEFISSVSSAFEMYVSNSYDFIPSVDNANVIAMYVFGLEGRTRQLQLSTTDISSLGTSALDDYLYVRFICNVATTLTPELWNANSCATKSILISSGQTRSIFARSSGTLYRLKYDDWKGGDFKINWTGNSSLPVYIGQGCDFMISSTDPNVVMYKNLSRRSTITVKENDVEALGSYVDEQGFLYVRFNPTNKGNVTFTSTKPVEEDSPCVLASTLLEPKAELVLNLDKAFDIYRIDYQAWLASGVKLVWTGASPLHTFVAKDCEFAVAIYHKDVVNYTEVPAEGNVILSKDILATLGQYVDEDGYLYIRFLTELEGILTIAKAE